MLRVFVVWEPVTPSDHNVTLPPTSVLGRIPDPRASQWWDGGRLLSKRMLRDIPRDTLRSLAELDSVGNGIAWDCVALFAPGKHWGRRFPVPDWSGRPILDVADSLPRRLADIGRSLPPAGR